MTTAPPSSRPPLLGATAVALLLVVAVFRPGIDRLDRRLAQRFWDVPSEWNAIADVAIRTGVVDGTIGGRPAPWRHASVVPVGTSRAAVIVVSDLQTTRVSIVDPDYVVRGRFARETVGPSTVTDEARAYKPISHVWPFVIHGDRLETLVASATLVSEAPNMGRFAYIAVGRADTELLFVVDLRWGPGPTWGVLERTDVNGDGQPDFVVLDRGRRDLAPLATFIWREQQHAYAPQLAAGADPLVAFWSTSAERRVMVAPDQPIDAAMRTVMGETAATIHAPSQ